MSLIDVEHQPADYPGRLETQAAAELVQEFALVSRSLFAQLLPETPMRAIAGVTANSLPGMRQAPSEQTAAPQPGHHAAEVAPGQPSPSTSPSAPIPMAVPIAVAAGPEGAAASPSTPPVADAPVTSVPVPGVVVPAVAVPSAPVPVVQAPEPTTPAAVPFAIPVPSVPVDLAAPDDTGAVHDAPATPARPEHVSLAMLEEIGFLDE
jgi:hypothetical protein